MPLACPHLQSRRTYLSAPRQRAFSAPPLGEMRGAPARQPSFLDAAQVADACEDSDGRPRKRFRSSRPDRSERSRASSSLSSSQSANGGLVLSLGGADRSESRWPLTPAASPTLGPRTLPNELPQLPESTEVR